MTPGPSSMPFASAQDGRSSSEITASSSSSSLPLATSQPRPNDTTVAAASQPKTCLHCGRQLDFANGSSDRLAIYSTPSSVLSAPSPSSIAFAPDGPRVPQQPVPSLTSAINAAAAAALSRHLAAAAADSSNPTAATENEGQVMCTACTAAVSRQSDHAADRRHEGTSGPNPLDTTRLTADPTDSQSDYDMHQEAPRLERPTSLAESAGRVRPDLDQVASRQEARSHASRMDDYRRSPSEATNPLSRSSIGLPASTATASNLGHLVDTLPHSMTSSSTVGDTGVAQGPVPIPDPSASVSSTSTLAMASPRRQAPWAASRSGSASADPSSALSINVGNMGAGGDAPQSPLTNEADFPPLGRTGTSPALQTPISPGRSPTQDRGRTLFGPGSPPTSSSSRFRSVEEHAAHTTTSPRLGRSGSFSRSLSYSVPGSQEAVGLSGSAPVVSFPQSSVSQPVLQAMQSASAPHGRLRRSSSSNSGTAIPAPAGAVPGAAKARRPSVTRRLSRSSSSTAPTSISFAAVGTTSSALDHPPFAIEEDPYGPASVTKPRLSTIPSHVISENLDCSRSSRTYTAVSSKVSATSHRDGNLAIKTLPNPLRYPYAKSGSYGPFPLSEADMDVDRPTAKYQIDEARWYDPLRPDPLMEISRVRLPPKGRGCLCPGAIFNGTQKSGRNSYDVTVRIVNVDIEASHLCGYLNIRGLTEDWPELTTYFDAEIIGDRHGFVTGKWGATEADDLKHWARFLPFRPLRSGLTKPGLNFNHLNKPYVFMRWKERFLVPDHRVRDINGASFAGFYYVCVELGSGGTGDTGRRPTHTVLRSPSGSEHGAADATAGATHMSQQWYAARANRRRESQSTQQPPAGVSSGAVNGVWPPSPPATMPSPVNALVGGASPSNKEREEDRTRDEAMDDVDEVAETGGKMLGFYFHENSEPYQQLSLHHVAQRSSAGFELR